MTYQELQQLCQRKSGNKTADALEGFKIYLNLMQKDMAGRCDYWPELQASGTLSLTDGDEDYSLASDFHKLRGDTIRITGNNEIRIRVVPYEVFRQSYTDTSNDSEALPIIAYWNPNAVDTLNFYPIPDTSYTAAYDYIKDVTDMTNNGDEPFVVSRWRHILVDGALAMHYESAYEMAFDKAAYHWTRYENEMDKAIADASRRIVGQAGLQIDYGTGVNEDASY